MKDEDFKSVWEILNWISYMAHCPKSAQNLRAGKGQLMRRLTSFVEDVTGALTGDDKMKHQGLLRLAKSPRLGSAFLTCTARATIFG